jgi:hypothetical protein
MRKFRSLQDIQKSDVHERRQRRHQNKKDIAEACLFYMLLPVLPSERQPMELILYFPGSQAEAAHTDFCGLIRQFYEKSSYLSPVARSALFKKQQHNQNQDFSRLWFS